MQKNKLWMCKRLFERANDGKIVHSGDAHGNSGESSFYASALKLTTIVLFSFESKKDTPWFLEKVILFNVPLC